MDEKSEFRLRKPELDDVDGLYSFKNDGEIGSLLGGFTLGYSRSELLTWVERHATATDEAFFLIVDDADHCVGHVGLYKINHRVGSAEFAILLGDRGLWGKGLGKTITRQILALAFDQLNLRRIYLEVLSTNDRAYKLYRSIGFVEEGRLRQAQYKDGAYMDVIVMGLLRDEYERDDA